MMTLGATWLAEAAKGTSTSRLLVRIWTDTGVSSRYLDGPCQTDYPTSVLSVSQTGRSVDPWSRKISVDGFVVTLRSDDSTDALVLNNPLLGTRIEVHVGFDVLGEGDFEPLVIGTIVEVSPSENMVALKCRQATRYLEHTIVGSWGNIHPLELAEEILGLVGVPSDLINATSFDPTTHSGIEHWVVNRESTATESGDQSISTPTAAKEILDSLVVALGGMIAVQESGEIEYVHYPETGPGAAIDTWYERDLAGPPIIEAMPGEVANSVAAHGHFVSDKRVGNMTPDEQRYSPGSADEATIAVVADDTASQAAFVHANAVSSPGLTLTRGAANVWSSGVAQISLGDPSPGDWVFVSGPFVSYISGSRWPGFPAGSQPAATQVSAARPLYLLVGTEVVSFDQLSILGSQRALRQANSPGNGWGATINRERPQLANARVLARAQLDTSSYNHTTDEVAYDITQLVTMARMRRLRWRYGVPIIAVRTVGLHKYAVQYGDIVSLDVGSGYVRGYGYDGLDSSVTWEVVGKHPDLSSDEPAIKWTLAMAKNTNHAAVSPEYRFDGRLALSLSAQRMRAQRAGAFATTTIYSGFDQSSVGLDVTITSGYVVGGDLYAERPSDTTITLTASTTSWITYDIETQTMIVRESPTQPSLEGQEATLWQVVTDGSGVTSAVDMRVYQQGIVPAVVAAACISPAKITTVSEWQNLVPNGEFTSWAAPRDDKTLYPPDRWEPGTFVNSPPYAFSPDPDAWGPDPGSGANSGVYYTTDPTKLKTGDVGIHLWGEGIYPSSVPQPAIRATEMIPVSEDLLYRGQALTYTDTVVVDVPWVAKIYQDDKTTLVATYRSLDMGWTGVGFLEAQNYFRVPAGGRWAEIIIGRDESYHSGHRSNVYLDYFRLAHAADAIAVGIPLTTTIPGAGAWTPLSFTTIINDKYTAPINYGGGYVAAPNYQFTSWRPGLWTFHLQSSFTGLFYPDYGKIAIVKNGVPGAGGTILASQGFGNYTGAGSVAGEAVAATVAVPLAIGDTVAPYIQIIGSASGVTLSGANWFRGEEKKEL